MEMHSQDNLMNKLQLTDHYFMETRSKLLDIAAWIDRLQRADGMTDHRNQSFTACLPILIDEQPEKTRRILERLSDPTTEPIARAGEKGASGAWPRYTPDQG
jgi:hypothetical protein